MTLAFDVPLDRLRATVRDHVRPQRARMRRAVPCAPHS
jgi:hypothetical protein